MSAKVWVAYAGLEQQFHIEVMYESGMSIAAAIEKSGIQQRVELPQPLSFGIFGRKIQDLDYAIQPGDRVEIYRPLTINPKEIRRKRAAANPTSRYCRSNRFKQLN